MTLPPFPASAPAASSDQPELGRAERSRRALDDSSKQFTNHGMRLFVAAFVVVLLFAIDRAFLDGQNAEALLSLFRRIAAYLLRW